MPTWEAFEIFVKSCGRLRRFFLRRFFERPHQALEMLSPPLTADPPAATLHTVPDTIT